MRSVPAGTYARFSTREALWRAYETCRRGKARQPRMAAFDVNADREVLALAHAQVLLDLPSFRAARSEDAAHHHPPCGDRVDPGPQVLEGVKP